MATNSTKPQHEEERDTSTVLEITGDTEKVDWVIEDEEEEDARVTLGIVGRVWTERNVNANALISTMRRIWNPRHGMEANLIEKNVFFFQFYHWRDKEQILEAQPWHFDRHALILSEIQGTAKPSDIPLHSIPFWVRAYDLPLRGRTNVDNARTVGNKVGTFMEVDTSDIIGINKSMRVRSLIDARRPLRDKILLKMKGGREFEVKIKYEKLPLFCYVCGMLGHGEKDCDATKGGAPVTLQFSDELRASPWKANRGGRDDGQNSANMGCAKKLFITKKKKEVEKGEVECVNEMMKKLETVSLCVEEEVQGEGVKQIATHAGQTRGSDGESKEIRVTKQGLLPGSEVGQDTKKVGGNGTDEVGKVTEVTGDNVVRQVEPTGASLLPPLNFSVGCSSSTTGRKYRKFRREGGGIGSQGVDGEAVSMGGKRKDCMEIDEEEDGLKRTKQADREGCVKVAVVGLHQPREYQ